MARCFVCIRYRFAASSASVTVICYTANRFFCQSGFNNLFDFFASGRNRTCDLRIRSPALYPTELRAQTLPSCAERFLAVPVSGSAKKEGCLMGFEPTTTRSTIWRSTTELQAPRKLTRAIVPEREKKVKDGRRFPYSPRMVFR